MGLFKLFQEKRYFRLILFLLLSLIVVSFERCDLGSRTVYLDYGYPAVYIEQSKEYLNLNTISTFNLNIPNLLINIILILVVFFVIEIIRNISQSSNNAKIFDICLLFVFAYLTIGSVLNIIAFYSNNLYYLYLVLLYFYPVKIVIDVIGVWSFSLYQFISFNTNLFPNRESFYFRLGVLITSVLQFFILYYILKLYYIIKIKKTK